VRIHLIAVGTRMPRWVGDGYHEYARRLPKAASLHLVEIASGPRSKAGSPARALAAEGRRLLAAIPSGARVVALDERGAAWSTRALAARLQRWMQGGRDVALLVGGPDGLAECVLARADARWSLSTLTLPHGLVRVVVAEQLYRAWTVLDHHPYHRE
jgi:23S rRNA (pseudouridine1915-N3)-methyltransferase